MLDVLEFDDETITIRIFDFPTDGCEKSSYGVEWNRPPSIEIYTRLFDIHITGFVVILVDQCRISPQFTGLLDKIFKDPENAIIPEKTGNPLDVNLLSREPPSFLQADSGYHLRLVELPTFWGELE